MSVRLTDPENVALYDSVTGHAFGEVFESAELAEDFLDWAGLELRGFTDAGLATLRLRWQLERVDPETGGLYEGAVAA